MKVRSFIKAALIGFNYPKKIKEKLVDRFASEIARRGIEDHAEIYRFVTDSLDWEDTSPQFRYALLNNSLDASPSNEGKDNKIYGRNLERYNYHGANDINLERVIDGSPQKEENLVPLGQALKEIEGKIDGIDFKILKELQSRTNGAVQLSLNGHTSNELADIVKEKVNIIRKVFYSKRDGLILPDDLKLSGF